MSEPDRRWMVMSGQPLDTSEGGGFEFFGPFTEDEAKKVREIILEGSKFTPGERIVIAIELILFSLRYGQ